MQSLSGHKFKTTGFSNAIPLCFFDAECIKKRDEEQQQAANAIAQQQALLMQLANTPTGRLGAGTIALIVLAIAGAAFGVVYFIKKNKIKPNN